jgi:hypothetical protein
MLAELRMLDYFNMKISYTGSIGAAYFSQRLLSRDVLPARLSNVRRIASRFSQKESDSAESYVRYINDLSVLIATSMHYFETYFKTGPDPYAEYIYDYDVLSAAAYTNKLSVVEELSEHKENLRQGSGTLTSPYYAASLGDNVSVMEHLLRKNKLNGTDPRSIILTQFRFAAENGSKHIVEYLLHPDWKRSLVENDRQDIVVNTFDKALHTPDTDIFDFLISFRETIGLKNLTQEQLASLLTDAVKHGRVDMTAKLLQLGAPTEGKAYGHQVTNRPLIAACRSGNKEVVRQLLEHGAKLTGHEIGQAAEKGQMGMLKLLMEYGANVNRGIPEGADNFLHSRWYLRTLAPIVSAVRLEHTDMFYLLVENGAILEGEVGLTAAKRAREEGLKSMLVLLQDQGVKANVKTL